MRRGFDELISVLHPMVNAGALPDEGTPLTIEVLIEALRVVEDRASSRDWEDDMGDDL
jgi:hypothetical protein